MSDSSPTDEDETAESVQPQWPSAEAYARFLDRIVQGIEVAAATVFAVLFAVGVVDITLQIVTVVRDGTITDPLVVIGFIDTGLLLLIIVEVYQTVLAYVRENETRRIVQLVIYTGVIAMVRKVIIFRTAEYASVTEALLAAAAYSLIILALVGLILAERGYGDGLLSLSDAE
jgi:uncharacterized membrane protein (DUF373 family)